MRPFLYQRPADRTAALHTILAENAALMGGGTTLLDLMKLDTMRPAVGGDINDLPPENGMDASAGGLHLSAFVKMAQAAAHADVVRDYPVIAQALLLAARPQI